MQFLDMAVVYLPHLVRLGVPVGHAIHVATAAAAVGGDQGAAQEVRGAHAASAVELVHWAVVEVRRRRGIPTVRAPNPSIPVLAPVPPQARHGVSLRFATWLADVVDDEIHDDLHTSCATLRHHALELRRRARARVKAEGDRLVLRPPLRPADVLGDRRELHRVEPIRPEVLPALSRDVVVVPLPQLHEDRRPPILAPPAARRRLELAEVAVDLKVIVHLSRLLAEAARAARLALNLELLGLARLPLARPSAMVGGRRDIDLVKRFQGDGLGRPRNVLELEHLPIVGLLGLRLEQAPWQGGDVAFPLHVQAHGAARHPHELEDRALIRRVAVRVEHAIGGPGAQVLAVRGEEGHVAALRRERLPLRLRSVSPPSRRCPRSSRGAQLLAARTAPHLAMTNLEDKGVAASGPRPGQALPLGGRLLAKVIQAELLAVMPRQAVAAQIPAQRRGQVAVPERAQRRLGELPDRHVRRPGRGRGRGAARRRSLRGACGRRSGRRRGARRLGRTTTAGSCDARGWRLVRSNVALEHPRRGDRRVRIRWRRIRRRLLVIVATTSKRHCHNDHGGAPQNAPGYPDHSTTSAHGRHHRAAEAQ
mmetsp:Transcript_4618/g.13346  ORF Transcript_4618/g.13346 Transcript_4618/m.13346 type:complete len:593 (-) Transcript_4618:42-1820(-)